MDSSAFNNMIPGTASIYGCLFFSATILISIGIFVGWLIWGN